MQSYLVIVERLVPVIFIVFDDFLLLIYLTTGLAWFNFFFSFWKNEFIWAYISGRIRVHHSWKPGSRKQSQ